jgi:hypothetical protein
LPDSTAPRPLALLGALAVTTLAVATVAGCPAADPVAECPPDQVLDAIDVDDLGCVDVSCGAGPWGALQVGPADVFVAPWGADPDEGGDGSEGSPLARVRDGARAAAEAGGARVVLAAGTYLENLTLDAHDGVEIVGRCTERVVLDGSRDALPTVLVGPTSVALRGLTITGGEVGLHAVGGSPDSLSSVRGSPWSATARSARCSRARPATPS